MKTPWELFLDQLQADTATEYGDFKREMDHQLRLLVDNSPPMSEFQQRTLAKIREDFLWTDHPDEEIEDIKREIRHRIERITPLVQKSSFVSTTESY